MSWFVVYTGPKFSGTTDRALRRVSVEESLGKRVVRFQCIAQNDGAKYNGDFQIRTNAGRTVPATAVRSIDEIDSHVAKTNAKVVLVNDIQHLGEEAVDYCRNASHKTDGSMLVVTAPNRNWRGEPQHLDGSRFHVGHLMAYATDLELRTARCTEEINGKLCGAESVHTQGFCGDRKARYDEEPTRLEARCMKHHAVPGRPSGEYSRGEVHVIFSGMFGGKTAELIEALRKADAAGRKTLAFKAGADCARYSQSEICTHDGDKYPAIVVNRAEEIIPYLSDVDEAGIDEIIFLGRGALPLVRVIAHSERTHRVNIPILARAYTGERFPIARFENGELVYDGITVAQILPYATSISVRYGRCTHPVNGEVCQGQATQSQRWEEDGSHSPYTCDSDIFRVGGKADYGARCNNHLVVPGHPLRKFHLAASVRYEKARQTL